MKQIMKQYGVFAGKSETFGHCYSECKYTKSYTDKNTRSSSGGLKHLGYRIGAIIHSNMMHTSH